MALLGRYKLLYRLPKAEAETGVKQARKPRTSQEVITEQTRETAESRKAYSAKESSRERMVEVGRGNQQAGRQGS
jgi:hypothetical protein